MPSWATRLAAAWAGPRHHCRCGRRCLCGQGDRGKMKTHMIWTVTVQYANGGKASLNSPPTRVWSGRRKLSGPVATAATVAGNTIVGASARPPIIGLDQWRTAVAAAVAARGTCFHGACKGRKCSPSAHRPVCCPSSPFLQARPFGNRAKSPQPWFCRCAQHHPGVRFSICRNVMRPCSRS